MFTGNREDVCVGTHSPSAGGAGVSDTTGCKARWGRASNALSVPVQSLLQNSVLIPAKGLKLSVEGTSPADMDAGRSRSQASLPSFAWIFSAPINLLLTLNQSLDLASI